MNLDTIYQKAAEQTKLPLEVIQQNSIIFYNEYDLFNHLFHIETAGELELVETIEMLVEVDIQKAAKQYQNLAEYFVAAHDNVYIIEDEETAERVYVYTKQEVVV